MLLYVRDIIVDSLSYAMFYGIPYNMVVIARYGYSQNMFNDFIWVHRLIIVDWFTLSTYILFMCININFAICNGPLVHVHG